ncbi:hypothetical protein L9F63_007043, partial [Diploptera punctata]
DVLTQQYLEFDFSDVNSVKALGNTFLSSSTTDKWIDCSKAGYQCCQNMDKDSVMNPEEGHCPAIWDGYTCFNEAQNGSIQNEACPSFMYSSSPPTCQQYNNKECFGNGTWNQQTDYSPCTSNPIVMMRERNSYYVIMLSISLGICVPALIIFISYSKLRITRVNLHRNLILAIVIRNTFYIAAKEAIIIDALVSNPNKVQAIVENSVWCRTVSFMEKLSCSAVYSCMLLEGIFLHRIIADAFKGEPNMKYYYIVAVGITCIPVAIWTSFTAVNNNINCWQVDINSYNYIVDGPRLATLAINALLMFDIVRVLCTKLKRINTAKAQHMRRMTRATILLIPLFGVQFLITTQRPVDDDCVYEQLYYYFFYTMDGLQGALVALLYCFLNKEVQIQLYKTYAILMTRFYSLLGKEYVQRRRPTWNFSEHRVTATSILSPDEILFRASVSSQKMPVGLLSDPAPSKPRLSVTFSENGYVYGNVNAILSQREGLHTPRSSECSVARSFKGDDMPKRQFYPKLSNRDTNKLRRFSSVVEENHEEATERNNIHKDGESERSERSKSLQENLGRSNETLFRDGKLLELTENGVNLGFSTSSEEISNDDTLHDYRRSNDSGNYSTSETHA